MLDSAGIPYVLLGGLAAAAWGRVRATLDLDFSLGVQPGAEQLDRLLDDLEEAGFRVNREGIRSRLSRGIHIVTVHLGKTRTDFFLERPDSFWAASLRNRKILEVMGMRLPVASVEDLIAYKLVSDREIDREDARYLVSVNSADLDVSALRRTLRELAEKRGHHELTSRLSALLGQDDGDPDPTGS